jgi:hypothetical protein
MADINATVSNNLEKLSAILEKPYRALALGAVMVRNGSVTLPNRARYKSSFGRSGSRRDYPYLAAANVKTTLAADYMALVS